MDETGRDRCASVVAVMRDARRKDHSFRRDVHGFIPHGVIFVKLRSLLGISWGGGGGGGGGWFSGCLLMLQLHVGVMRRVGSYPR